MDTINDILNFKKPKQNFYDILGCSVTSNQEQICTEYRRKALKLHPDKNVGNPELSEEFKLVQKAKEVLTDEKLRKEYDNWLNSGIAMDFEVWLAHNKTHSMHWAKPRQKNTMIEETEFAKSKNLTSKHDSSFDANSDLLSKFRNYEI